MLLYDKDDPESGLLDPDDLAEQADEWPDYGAPDTHDFTPADWEMGLGEVDCGGE